MAGAGGDIRRGELRLVLGLIAALAVGCSRAHYRRDADRETYGVIEQKTDNTHWPIPQSSIDPPRESRLHDSFDPDCPPIPPDDPTAHETMHCANCIEGYDGWHEHGDAPWIEDPAWRDHLPFSADGTLLLSPTRSVQMGLLHSRTYQTALEELYLAALRLSLERFAFDVQWFGGNTTAYEHFGTSSVPRESNTLSTTSNLGFTRAFATGGQALLEFANSFVWEFTGSGSSSASSNIGVRLVQPFLRGAGREVRLESLTQSERDVLYAARRFARFRKEFYVDIVAGDADSESELDNNDDRESDSSDDGFLSLLLKVQRVRNLEANVGSLEQNLRVHEALAQAGVVSPIQVDQVFQRYQEGRLALIEARNELETSQDSYKIELGLPPDLPVQLEDTLLAPFQLTSPALSELERDVDRLLAEFREPDEAPSRTQLQQGFTKLTGLYQRLATLFDEVGEELNRMKSLGPRADTDDPSIRTDRERAAQQQLATRFTDLTADFKALDESIRRAASSLSEESRKESWELLQNHARYELAFVNDLFVLETQVRAYLIELESIKFEQSPAIEFALDNRLDLMNQRARVVDAWRKITVAADRLESDLDVFFEGDIATKPGGDNPVDFSAAASRYRVGFRFDAPLNRMAERNIYRATLINYQRLRRAYMQAEDEIVQDIRREFRELNADRLNFEITRQRVIAAARQVEESRDQLVAPGRAGDSSDTQDVLNALNSLLQAKNDLIEIWINYETGRLQLMLELEAMQLDDRGVYTDEHDNARTRDSGPPDSLPAGSEEPPAP